MIEDSGQGRDSGWGTKAGRGAPLESAAGFFLLSLSPLYIQEKAQSWGNPRGLGLAGKRGREGFVSKSDWP